MKPGISTQSFQRGMAATKMNQNKPLLQEAAESAEMKPNLEKLSLRSLSDYSNVETNMFVLTPELSQEVAKSAEPGHQNSAASASSCKNGFVFWLFAIGEPLVPGAIREKGRATISKSDVFSRAFFLLGHSGHGGNTEATEEDELLCA
ncbi:MAG: hypothetical protein ACREH8_13795, partial [Opitutaceae bacterium]